MKKRIVIGIISLLCLFFLTAEAFGQQKIRINLNSNVRGADVFIDGKLVGKTPFSGITNSGRHLVKVSRDGYIPLEKSIVFRSDTTFTMELQKDEAVEPVKYKLKVEANINGANVSLNDKMIGKTPTTIEITKGEYEIKVTAAGYEDFRRDVKIDDDATVYADLKKMERFFTLSVTANVNKAEVFVNGKEIGSVPLRTKLVEGEYTVKVAADGYEEFVQDVDLNRDERIHVNLKKIERFHNLKVDADVRGAQVSIDGKAMGAVPLRTKLLEGQYTVKVMAPGYEDFVTKVKLDDDTNVDAKLEKIIRFFNLSIGANVRNARVSIDDKMMGTTPLRTKVMEGQHEIKVTAPDHEDYSVTIELNRDQSITADLERIRRFYDLTIVSDAPRSQVFINDKEQDGDTPLTVKLEEGTYKIMVRARRSRPFQTTIVLNRDMTVKADLLPENSRIKVLIPEMIIQRDRFWKGNRIVIIMDGRIQKGFEFEAEAGRHTVRVEAGSWFVEEQINCRDGRAYTLKPVFSMEVTEGEE